MSHYIENATKSKNSIYFMSQKKSRFILDKNVGICLSCSKLLSVYPCGEKTMCYCHTCKKQMSSLGIARHRAMHRDKKEDCEITYTSGIKYFYNYSRKEPKS